MADQVSRMASGLSASFMRFNGDVKVRGGTVLIKDEIHAFVFDLAIHHTSEGRNGLPRCTLWCRCVSVSHRQGFWHLRHACDRHHRRIGTHSNDADARQQV